MVQPVSAANQNPSAAANDRTQQTPEATAPASPAAEVTPQQAVPLRPSDQTDPEIRDPCSISTLYFYPIVPLQTFSVNLGCALTLLLASVREDVMNSYLFVYV